MVSPVFVSQYQRGSECDILSISEIMCTQFCNYSENESRKTSVLLIVHQTHSVFGKDIILNYYILIIKILELNIVSISLYNL